MPDSVSVRNDIYPTRWPPAGVEKKTTSRAFDTLYQRALNFEKHRDRLRRLRLFFDSNCNVLL
jgi:hypothetical protein